MPNLNPVGQECWQAWLPVEQRITYNLCLFMHLIHNGQAPQYLSDCVSTVSAVSHRYRLRSSGSAAVYVLPRTRTRSRERGFFYSGPAAWNTLPSDLHDITDTSIHSENDSTVYCFDRAYHWLLLALLDVSYSGALRIPCWLIDGLVSIELVLVGVESMNDSWWNEMYRKNVTVSCARYT